MDFFGMLRENYDNLKSKEIVNVLWKEMLKEERLEDYLDQLIEYSFHYPVDSDSYLEALNEEFDNVDKEELRTIDGHLRAYMITFLYYCTNRYARKLPARTTVLASNLYLKLISVPDVGQFFFEKNMFKLQLFVCISTATESSLPEIYKIYTMKLLKKYCLQEKLEIFLLKGVANTFTGVMMVTTTEVVEDADSVQLLALCCINALKELILHEDDNARLICIMEGLFRCLRKDNNLEYIGSNEATRSVIQVSIKDILQEELDEDKFQYLLDAFSNCWGKEDFAYFEDAVIIMNELKLQYYKELVRKMVMYTQSRNHKRFLSNIMSLMLAMARNLPKFSLHKIEVLYSCAIRNIMYYFIDKNKKLVDKSIETVTSFCLMKDNLLVDLIFNHVSCSGRFVNMSIEALLICLNKVADEKWGISPRNQNLLVIMARFLSSNSRVNSELIQKTLDIICKDFTPFSLRQSLPVFHALFCSLAMKDEIQSAEAVLKIIYKSAMHHDAISMEFAEHIYFSMLNTSVIDNIIYGPHYYFNIFLRTDFEYEALFTKCQRHIKSEHVQSVIVNFNYKEPGAAVLLRCLLDFCKYKESAVIIEYFINNFTEIAISETMGPMSIALKKILTNRKFIPSDAPQLDVLQNYLLEGLFEQTYQVPSIKPAFDLLQKLRTILKMDMEDQMLLQLLRVTSERAFRRLHVRETGDHSVFMYLNELCLLLKKPPTDNVVASLEMYMEDPRKIQELNTYMSDVYLQLLTLFTTLAMMNKRKVPLASKYLQEVLTSETQITKILGFKLYYSLCLEMTHEFREVIKFAFKEIVVIDPCLSRLCIIAIEQLVHDDVIKLDEQTFFKFVHVLGSDDLGIFVKEVLMKRFVLSNQHDMAKYYVYTIVHLHMYSKFQNYPISHAFEEELVIMGVKLDCKYNISIFLFTNLAIRKKFNVLMEITLIFDDLVRGECKIETNFFPMLKDLIMTFRYLKNPSVESIIDKHYYSDVCKEIETKIVKSDPSYEAQNYYSEYDAEIRKCTLSLLKLLFCENQQIDSIQVTLFDAIMHWIDFVKDEIITYIHAEQDIEYAKYFPKLLLYFKRHKGRFTTPDSFRLELLDPTEEIR